MPYRNSGSGKQDRERRALADDGTHLNVTTMRAHDLVTDRKSEAGAVGARREERLEDARQIVGLDAAAAILDLDRDARCIGRLRAHRDACPGRARLGRIADEV